MNPITNAIPVHSHTHTRGNINGTVSTQSLDWARRYEQKVSRYKSRGKRALDGTVNIIGVNMYYLRITPDLSQIDLPHVPFFNNAFPLTKICASTNVTLWNATTCGL